MRERPGIFRCNRPASAIFTNFNDVCKKATWDFYRGIFGSNFQMSQMHSTDDLFVRQELELENQKSLKRFFQGTFNELRSLPLPTEIPKPEDLDTKATAVQLREARTTMLKKAANVRELQKNYRENDKRHIEAIQGRRRSLAHASSQGEDVQRASHRFRVDS